MKQSTLAPPSYGCRAPVGLTRDWAEPGYMARFYEANILSSDPRPNWADPPTVPKTELDGRLTYVNMRPTTLGASGYEYDSALGAYLNPIGKTGIAGRGMLGKYGPNHAADVLITRWHKGVHQVLVVEKRLGDGTSNLAWPAGMVEPGEAVPETLRRELVEEAVADGDAVERLFDTCRKGVVYAGFVDDWRNTDHAWMETNAVHFHATEEIGALLELRVTDLEEVRKSFWIDSFRVTEMYASHIDWLNILRRAAASELFVSHVDWPPHRPPFVSYASSPSRISAKRSAQDEGEVDNHKRPCVEGDPME
jgi:ADP-ribose pyrophosphatase